MFLQLDPQVHLTTVLLQVSTNFVINIQIIHLYQIDKISVQDMVNATMKNNDIFGIQGYNLPRHEYPIRQGNKNLFGKEKGKNFAD